MDASRRSRGRRPQAAPRRGSLPIAGVTVSLFGHAILLGALAFFGLWYHQTASKVYVVNLVAGLSSAASAPTPELTPQPPTPPKAEPTPPPSPRELPQPAPKLPPPAEEPRPSLPPRLAQGLRPRDLPPPALPRLDDRKRWVPRDLPPRREQTDEKPERQVSRAVPPPPAPAPTTPSARGPGAPQPMPSAGTAAVSAQASDFPFTWYLRRILAKVQERWAEQPQISPPSQRPIIFVEISRDGSIKPPRLEQSSGNAFYDQAALRAITEAGPFPPLPQEWSRPTLRIQFGFEVQPRRG